ncbi:MAG TPA: PAS domain-containing protein [Usitatibacter sp.]|nr:PAS domain-containing protein [Usitatibacter sp.]
MTGTDYLRVLRSAPALLLVLRPDEGYTIVEASDDYLRATMTTREQIVGRPVFEVFPDNPEDPKARGEANLRASLARVIATGLTDVMPMHRYDVRRPAHLGGGFEERWWNPANAPVLGDDGRVHLIVHRIEDATALAKAQRAAREEHDRLVETNQRLQAIYDQGIFAGRLDRDGRVVDVNRSALEQCGYTREDVMGKPFWDCGWWNRAPDVQAWVKAATEQALRGEPFRGESRYFLADGSERTVEFACMPIRDAAGEVAFVVPTGIDITERARAERDLRATEILDSITEGFVGVDREWRFTYVNREARTILGADAANAIDRSLWEVFPGLLGTGFERAYRQAMDERVPASLTAYYPDHRRWYDVHAYPSATGISIYFRDITRQKSLEAERERLATESDRQRRTYEVALSNTPDLVFIFDLQHRFVYANEALLAMWGVTREQAIGKTTRELGYPDWEVERHDREISEVVATRRPVRGAVPFEGATGLRVWDYIFAPVIGPDGDVVAIAGTARDATEQRATQEALETQSRKLQEADRAKDEFIATLSHELRNPLSPLRSSVALLRMNRNVDERTARIHEMMERQIDHLVRLVDDLLEISRVSRGDFALRKERVALAALVRNALETTEPLLHARKHRVSVSLPEAPVWVEADPVRMAQVIANLVDNAAKYTPEGGSIDVSVQREDGTAVVRVRDNGAGIAEESRQRIFQMFDRGDRRTVHGEGGLGIGLALARQLAEMHGATLEVASEGVGRGSEFTVRIHVAPPPEAVHAANAPAADGVAAKRILVVDDNRDAADSLGMILRELGAEVRIAHDGAEAIDIFPQFEPAAVLLDIGMPHMDGYEVARTLRGRFPDRHTPLIALTGWGQQEDRARARQAGFDHHIVKPADIKALQALLSSLAE